MRIIFVSLLFHQIAGMGGAFIARRLSCSTQPHACRQVNLQRVRHIFFSSTRVADVASSSNDIEDQYLKIYRLDGVGHRSQVQITTNTGHQLRTDVPKKMGGSDTAPQPVEMLLAAWMGCTQATALFVGRQMSPRILIESLEFEGIQAVRDERGAVMMPIEDKPSMPSRLQRVTGVIRVISRNTSSLSIEQLHLLKEQTEVRCPVANMMIASGCSMDVDWIDGTAVTE